MVFQKLQTEYPNIAYLYAIVGHICVSLMQVFFKYLTAIVSPLQILFMRAFTLCCFNIFYFECSGKTAYITQKKLFLKLMMRTICTSGGSAILHYCVKYLPVSTTITLFNTSPIFIYFIEAFYFKKPFNKISLSLTIICFIGVVLIIQPQFLFGSNLNSQIQNFSLLVGLMLLSALMVGMGYIFIHDIGKNVDMSVNLHYSYMGHMFFTSVFGSCFHPPHIIFDKISPYYVLMFIGVVLSGFACQYLVYTSNLLKKPSKVTPFAYAGIVTGFLADVYLFQTEFSLMAVLGMLLTSSGLLGKFLMEREQLKQPSEKASLSVVDAEQAIKQ